MLYTLIVSMYNIFFVVHHTYLDLPCFKVMKRTSVDQDSHIRGGTITHDFTLNHHYSLQFTSAQISYHIYVSFHHFLLVQNSPDILLRTLLLLPY